MQPSPDVTIREPKLISSTHYCVVGDVTVDAAAAIAPGVVLQAASGSRIIIGSGVCIAAGVCIQSRAGILTIASGVSLGANVLVIGSGTIGINACVSPNSTIINPTVAANAILPPASLIGAEIGSENIGADNKSHEPVATSTAFSGNGGYQNGGYQNGSSSTFVEPGPVTAQPISIPDISDQSSAFVPPPLLNQPFSQPYNAGFQSVNNHNGNLTNGVQSGSSSSSLTANSNQKSNSPVYGKSQVTELIAALFPHRQSLNDSSSS